jgi:hypothetical protein
MQSRTMADPQLANMAFNSVLFNFSVTVADKRSCTPLVLSCCTHIVLR